jgi:peptide-methionine (R)-S-oxide reductase
MDLRARIVDHGGLNFVLRKDLLQFILLPNRDNVEINSLFFQLTELWLQFQQLNQAEASPGAEELDQPDAIRGLRGDLNHLTAEKVWPAELRQILAFGNRNQAGVTGVGERLDYLSATARQQERNGNKRNQEPSESCRTHTATVLSVRVWRYSRTPDDDAITEHVFGGWTALSLSYLYTPVAGYTCLRFLETRFGLPAQTSKAEIECKGGRPLERKFAIEKSDEQWKEELDPQAYHVLREHGTEPPFQNKYNDHDAEGVYLCGACGQPLFSSEAKFDSGSGWPSFYEPIDKGALGMERDSRFGMERTEIHCSRCGGHIGHVFTDGPAPTGLRYCTNSAALRFQPEGK